MYKILTTIVLIFFLTQGYAQEYSHLTSWNRIAIQKKVNTHWEVMAEAHLRWQNDFTSGSLNPFALKLLRGYRLSATYRLKNIAFSFSPFLLNSFPLYGKDKDLTLLPKTEFRPTLYTELTKTLTTKWTFRSRLGYEYRIFKRVDDSWGDEQGRIRLRVQLRYNLNENNTILASEEPLYNIPPHQPANTFSQNQLYFAYNHAFSPHFTTEIGYIWNHRQRASLVEFDEENILQTHFIFRL